MMRNLCLAVVLRAPGTWVLTGSIWGEVNVAEQCSDLARWRAEEGYTAELALLDLTHTQFRCLTHHLRELQRRWRQRWRRRVHVWLRERVFTGTRQPPTDVRPPVPPVLARTDGFRDVAHVADST
jgi:hypothetical protein